jgi:hypothetical protein
MALRIGYVAGAALNFGGRRLETIARVAWLPVLLLFVVEMATVYGTLSIATGRFISFTDANWQQAHKAVEQFAAAAWTNKSQQMWTLHGASLLLQAVLISSFMAPLVRYAGLGEKPAPGVVRLAFGPDQIRYIVAGLVGVIMPLFMFLPIGATAFFVLKYVFEALSKIYAHFPDPESLHTVVKVTGQELYAKRGSLWLYQQGIPLAAAAPFALFLWLALVSHFRPRKGESGGPSFGASLFAALVAGGGVVFLIWLVLTSTLEGAERAREFLAFTSLGIAIALYAGLRIAPYQGLAVCRRSFGVVRSLRLTRGLDLVRLLVVLIVIAVVMVGVLLLINAFAVAPIALTVNAAYTAAESYGTFLNGGETVPWIRPLFIWIASGVLILINVLVTFFNYGVFAGFLGALYRESERPESAT